MPTISSSRTQPLVTPSTALFTSARARPCTADCESFSRMATMFPSFCSTVMPDGNAVSSLPFGPCTATVLPSILTVTPLGIGIGFFPIRDIIDQLSAISSQFQSAPLKADGRQLKAAFLVNLAQQLAAYTCFARLAARHHAARRGEDVDTHASQHARNLAAAHIDAAAGTRHPFDLGDRCLVISAVLQINPDDLMA